MWSRFAQWPQWQRLMAALSKVGVDDADGDDVRLRKATMLLSSLLLIVAGAVWSALYFLLDRPLAAAIPLAYAILTVFNVLFLATTRRHRLFRVVQLSLTLALPFTLMVVLGGYIQGSAVIIWAFASPVGALLFTDLRYAHRWYLAFVLLVIVAVFVALPGPSFTPQTTALFFVANIIGVSLVTFLTLRYFVVQKNRTLALLEAERATSERLLLNVLPRSIANRLKANGEGQVIADAFEEVSVLFADVVGFTPLSEALPPQEMVRLLNDVFRHFDGLVAHYGVEKIRTIGDNYMVASGVPHPRGDHAHVLAQLALDMNAYLVQLPPTLDPQHPARRLRFRIGINSGPAIAGIIGQSKFHYDIWGDTVNIASRMESHGVAGKIQVTSATRRLIKNEFICTRRGVLDVKGKGPMETWFVEQRVPHAG